MAQLGLDPEQMQGLARQMRTEADTIDSIVTRITNKLHGTWWKGKDADKFRGDWTGVHTGNLRKVSAALKDVAKVVDSNVSQQVNASS